MNLENFIARRIIRDKGNALRFSKPVVNIAIVSIALSLGVMLLAIAIVTGFKKEITEKLIGLGAHITVTNLDNNYSFETNPVYRYPDFLGEMKKNPDVRYVQAFSLKHAILKTSEEIQGVLIKGIDAGYDLEFFNRNLVEGAPIGFRKGEISKEVIISRVIANRLQTNVGDTIYTYYMSQPSNSAGRKAEKVAGLSAFIAGVLEQGPTDPARRKPVFDYYTSLREAAPVAPTPRAVKLFVKGIYETGMYEFDEQLILGDMALVQQMYGWTDNDVSGFEIMIYDYKNLDDAMLAVGEALPSDLYSSSVRENYPDIFEWLPTVDINSVIIIVLMILVSIMAMVSTLLILILEKTNMIGILKALGMNNWSIRKIFLYQALYIIFRGMIFGNVIGLGLCMLQMHYGIIKLDQESYYLSEVPVNLDVLKFLLINISTVLVCALVLIIPSYLVTRISPLRAIRVD